MEQLKTRGQAGLSCGSSRFGRPTGAEVMFLGSGNASDSGGRLQTCFHLRATKSRPKSRFLIDCGASSLVAMRRFGVAPNEIGLILLSQLHGDHFSGIPFFLLDAKLVSQRTDPLIIAGPPGTAKRIEQTMEALFPGSSDAGRDFSLRIIELEPEQPRRIGAITVTPYVVDHPSEEPSLALRIECGGRVIAYSGDTEWAQSLIPAAMGVDLFIAEAYFFEKQVKYHFDFRTLMRHMDELQPQRLVVTHMDEYVRDRLDSLECECAEDGKLIEV